MRFGTFITMTLSWLIAFFLAGCLVFALVLLTGCNGDVRGGPFAPETPTLTTCEDDSTHADCPVDEDDDDPPPPDDDDDDD